MQKHIYRLLLLPFGATQTLTKEQPVRRAITSLLALNLKGK